jgi:hypothetical protein
MLCLQGMLSNFLKTANWLGLKTPCGYSEGNLKGRSGRHLKSALILFSVKMLKPNLENIAQRTVGIFSYLLDKHLTLHDRWHPSVRPVATDGYNLFVQKYNRPIIREISAELLFYRQVEHCLAHIVFGSNPTAKNLFVSHYTQAVEDTCKADKIILDSVKLSQLVNSIIMVIEDARVLGNWGRLYPGSVGDLKTAKKVLCRPMRRSDGGLLSLLVCAAGNNPGPEARLEHTSGVSEKINTAISSVRGASFGATLRATKWLVTRMVDLVSEQKNCSRPEALEYLVNCVNDRQPVAFTTYFVDLVEGSWARSTDKAKQDHELVSSALNAYCGPAGSEDLEFTDVGRAETRKLVAAISAKLQAAGNRPNQNNYTTDLSARIVITDSTGGGAATKPIDPLAKVLRAHFIKVFGRKLAELDEYGIQPDLNAVIQQRVSGNRQPIWTSTRKHRGFTALILVDLSESIKDSVIAINKSAVVLREAMNFGFSEILVWGFQSLDDGRVDIVRLADGQIDKKDVGGLTPLHLATSSAADFLSRTNNATHLFIVTDGHPVFVDTSGLMLDTEYIIRDVGKAVNRAREKGVGVSSLVTNTKETPAKSSLEIMFGAFGYWISTPGDLDKPLVSMVIRSFEKYLRSN